MNKNKFLALAMAGAMTLATAVPAFAADNETEVTLTVSKTNTYTITVPAKTALNSDGTAKELTNGIKIADGTLEDGKKLTVEATSKNNWTLKAEGVDTTIGYALYSDSAAATAATSWEFTQEQANSGATKAVYAKADATTLNAAKSGTYSDVITFTAAVVDAKIAVTSVSLNKSALTLEVGGRETLTATVTPDNATDKTVTWTTSDSSVATVDEDGSVKPVAAGTATITATADGKSASCTVTVEDNTGKIVFTINGTSYKVSEGTTWSGFAAGAGSSVVYVFQGNYIILNSTQGVVRYNGNGVNPSDTIMSGGVYNTTN